MELAKITSNGQITLPMSVRKGLNLKDGAKVAFIEQKGSFTIINPVALAIKEVQNAFSGEAERLGLETDQDIVDLVKGVRKQMHEESL